MPRAVCDQPRRLETLASARASQLALESCLVIQQRFPESQHLVEAKEVHGHFLTIRPLLDNVLNQCIATARAKPLGIRAEVLLDLLVHPAMKTLSYSYIPRHGTSSEDIPGFERYYNHNVFADDLYAREYDGKHLRVESRLWEKYLPQLGNLTDLNLMGIDIQLIHIVMKKVSTSCQVLEIISIRIESTSDIGALLHLVNIRSLRVIKSSISFYKIPFYMCDDLQDWVTELSFVLSQSREVVRYLLANLPLLEYIPIPNIGEILTRMKDTQADPLAIVECSQCHPSQANLEAIVSMCPNLTGLYLVGIYDDDSNDTFLDLSTVTGSNLQISQLVLCDLTIKPDGSLENFLRIKGSFIKHMRLEGIKSREMQIVPLLVGKHCPMLEILHLHLKGDQYLNGNHPSAPSAQSQEPMLQNLVEFKCITSSVTEMLWETLLPCLYAAERLKTINLQYHCQSRALLTQAMSNLLDNNPMLELEELVFENCEIQFVELISRLANLPKLRKLALHSCTLTRQVEAHLNSLRNAADNLDLLVTRHSSRYSDVFDGEVDLV